LLVLFSVLFVNCGYNIKVYLRIVTHAIPLRVSKNTSDSVHNQVGSKSLPKNLEMQVSKMEFIIEKKMNKKHSKNIRISLLKGIGMIRAEIGIQK
jgi:hypothetical protein